jgi:predicted DNA-binding protein
MRKKTFVRNVGLLLTEELYQRIVGITDKQEVTFSQFIRTAIEEALKNHEMEETRNG